MPPGGLEYKGAPLAPDEKERLEVLQALELLKDYTKYPGVTAICTLLKNCLSMTIAGGSPLHFRDVSIRAQCAFPMPRAKSSQWRL